jgi:hypothetical protein
MDLRLEVHVRMDDFSFSQRRAAIIAKEIDSELESIRQIFYKLVLGNKLTIVLSHRYILKWSR